MNIAKLLLPLTMIFALNVGSIEPASADNGCYNNSGYYNGCYDNYQCPGAYRRYPYWVPRGGAPYGPIQCGPNRRRYRHYRIPRYRHHQRRHHHGHCR